MSSNKAFETEYLDSVAQQFNYYKQLGDKAISQLSDQQIHWTPNDDSNSIAIIVNHLHGNMLSRWTNFLTTDGEKEWRKRDREFEVVIKTRDELLDKWETGWACLFQALSTVTEENLNSTVYIRNEAHSIIHAINRQLAHYASHVGQMVYLGKTIKGSEWVSLSIPKNKSEDFNAQMKQEHHQ